MSLASWGGCGSPLHCCSTLGTTKKKKKKKKKEMCVRYVSMWGDVAWLDPCVVKKKHACYEHWMALLVITSLT